MGRNIATVLVTRGCLKPGSHLIAGVAHAKVRMMMDSNSATVNAGYPGMAIIVSGWKVLPKAGDEVLQGTERDVKKALSNRLRKVAIKTELQDIEAINEQRRQAKEVKRMEGTERWGAQRNAVQQGGLDCNVEGPKELRLVIKGDVSGSVEAVVGALDGMGNKEATIKVVAT